MKTLNDSQSASAPLDLLTPDQTCEFLNLKRSMLMSLVFKKKIPLFRIGRVLRFSKSDLIQWLSEKKSHSPGSSK